MGLLLYKKRIERFNDCDYLGQLAPEHREYYRKFVAEYYFGRRDSKHHENNVLTTTMQRAAWRDQWKSRQDASNRAGCFDAEIITRVFDPMEALVELIDIARNFHREAEVQMEKDKKAQKEDAAAVAKQALEVAISVISQVSVPITEAPKVLASLSWLRTMRSSLEDAAA